jgi:hypothetical protein
MSVSDLPSGSKPTTRNKAVLGSKSQPNEPVISS